MPKFIPFYKRSPLGRVVALCWLTAATAFEPWSWTDIPAEECLRQGLIIWNQLSQKAESCMMCNGLGSRSVKEFGGGGKRVPGRVVSVKKE